MEERRVRVRFAPSPTGPLHIGGVRTALYNYLFARQKGGDLVFRIEDTDSTRFVPGAEAYILEAFRWLGITFDEGVSFGGQYGPYRQSERRDIYKQYVQQLLDAGKAYIAFDTPEELEQKRQEIQNFQYDNRTRTMMRNALTLPQDEVERLIAEGHQYVVRFRIDAGQEVLVDDLIRGEVRVKSDTLDDKVLFKSADQLPTYHLANIVDDHLMEITHVIRGEEWLPSAPLHVLLYQAFGWEDTMPRFAHLPLLLKPDGKGKLSKRDGDRLGFPVFPLDWHGTDAKTGEPVFCSGYREQGYFPEAVINFLALLGWNPGGGVREHSETNHVKEQELFTLDELVPLFDITKCSKAGAKFAYEKGIWFNHEYILQKSAEEIAQLFEPICREHGVTESFERIEQVVAMMKDRVSFVKELWPLCSFFFEAPTSYDEKTVKKRWIEAPLSPPEGRAPLSPLEGGTIEAGPRYVGSGETLLALCDVLEGLDDFSIENQERVVHEWIELNGLKMGHVMNAWRLALVGEGKGPGMFDISAFLGKEETLRRTRKACEVLG